MVKGTGVLSEENNENFFRHQYLSGEEAIGGGHPRSLEGRYLGVLRELFPKGFMFEVPIY